MSISSNRLNMHRLPMQLKIIPLTQLALIKHAQDDVYIYDEEMLQTYVSSSSEVTIELLKDLQTLGIKEVFVSHRDEESIKENLQKALVKITRSLSIGDPLNKGRKQTHLLSLNMQELYKNPLNDELLTMQYQSTLNLGKFLVANKKIQPGLYRDTDTKNHHFSIKQPLLSSILLLSFLQHTHLFHNKEIELLFITSYFKDIGMTFLSQDLLDKANLSDKEKELFENHTAFSKEILKNRTPINRSHLSIIENHHYLNEALRQAELGKTSIVTPENDLMGIETMLVGVMDIIVAMTSPRPYREEKSLYETLEILKGILGHQYPTEFKALILFLKHFFSKQ